MCCEWGGIATNDSHTLLALVNAECVLIQNVVECVDGPLSTTPCAVFRHRMTDPRFLCFAGGCVLVADGTARHIREFTLLGEHTRTINANNYGCVQGVAHCSQVNVLAVAVNGPDKVLLMDFSSLIVFSGVTAARSPAGVRFTADGLHVVVAEYGANRIGMYSVGTGDIVRYLATYETSRVVMPSDLLLFADGSLTVACCPPRTDDARLITINADGTTRTALRLQGSPIGLAAVDSNTLYKTQGSNVYAIPCDWLSSWRCVWVTCCSR